MSPKVLIIIDTNIMDIMAAEMVANMEVNKVADMVADK